MRIRLVRRPGQPGTQRYVAEYGDRLICVRYRYDSTAARRYKTIEIIVEEKPWQPPQTTPNTQPAPTAPTVLAGPAAPLPPPPPPPPPPPRVRASTRARSEPLPLWPEQLQAKDAHPTPPLTLQPERPRPKDAPPSPTDPPLFQKPAPQRDPTDQRQPLVEQFTYTDDTLVAVHIPAHSRNIELRNTLLKAGHQFDQNSGFWRLPYAEAKRLNLQHRIIGAVADLTGEQ